MKKIIIKLIILTSYFNPIVPINNIFQGTLSIFEKEYQYLWPGNAQTTKIATNIFKIKEIAPKLEILNNIFKMVLAEEKGLFYLLDNQARPTNNKSLPAYALNPNLIAEMIGILNTEIIKILDDKKIADNKKVEDFITKWRNNYIKEIGNKKRAKKTTRVKFKNLLIKIYKSYKTLPQETIKLLLSFANYKIQTKFELLNFIEKIGENITNAINKKNLSKNRENLNSNFKLSQVKASIEEIKNMSPSGLTNFIKNNYELFLFVVQNEFLIPPSLECILLKEINITDCSEATFLDFALNIILWNTKTKNYDLNLLPDNISLDETFKNLIKNIKMEDIYKKKFRLDFAKFITEFKNIKFVDKKYGLDTTAKNFLNLSNNIFIHKERPAKNFSELGKYLSKKNRPFKFIHSKIDNDTEALEVIIDSQSYKFYFQNNPKHAFSERRENKQTINKILIKKTNENIFNLLPYIKEYKIPQNISYQETIKWILNSYSIKKEKMKPIFIKSIEKINIDSLDRINNIISHLNKEDDTFLLLILKKINLLYEEYSDYEIKENLNHTAKIIDSFNIVFNNLNLKTIDALYAIMEELATDLEFQYEETYNLRAKLKTFIENLKKKILTLNVKNREKRSIKQKLSLLINKIE